MAEFDYEKYIWQIQFVPSYIWHEKYAYNTTIDFVKRLLIVRKTLKNENTTSKKIYSIDNDESYEKLLELSRISDIQEFESKTEDEQRAYYKGYRDGWLLYYSYFTNGKPPRTDGILSELYKGNPLEEIIDWVRKNYDDPDIRI